MQTKESKNGRLAMLATAGMAYQTYVTGQGKSFADHTNTESSLIFLNVFIGPWEQLTSGHISPFGDGQGFF